MVFAATSGILIEAGSQSLICSSPSADVRTGAPARNLIHMPSIPAINIAAAETTNAVATTSWRRGAGAGAEGNANVMRVPLVMV
ncbi:unannotated protein [freshwater metagenome]|uniref:Unannotated protein n=1 Tax=freshwater metagenome TaxID=449393 RepID=A0A6J6E5Y2_9ZZZZ